MNERHKGQLKLAHHLYDNRDLKQELMWQREFLDTGYLNYHQVCFNKWIFDECLKRLEERKIGHWIPCRAKYDNVVPVYECSICHENNGFDATNYCPNCGAKMEIEDILDKYE